MYRPADPPGAPQQYSPNYQQPSTSSSAFEGFAPLPPLPSGLDFDEEDSDPPTPRVVPNTVAHWHDSDDDDDTDPVPQCRAHEGPCTYLNCVE